MGKMNAGFAKYLASKKGSVKKVEEKKDMKTEDVAKLLKKNKFSKVK